MSSEIKWEYRVETFGSALAVSKDQDLEDVLNEWGEEGWQVISAYPIGDNKVRMVAQRSLISPARHKRRWP